MIASPPVALSETRRGSLISATLRAGRLGTAVLAVSFWVPGAVLAQEGRGDGARPEIRALRLERTVVVDGRLGEDIWRRAVPATGFTQRAPVEGAAATQATEVRIAYDDNAVYVAARLADTAAVSRRLGRRDSSLPGSDWFTIIFDSYHDHLTAFSFGVNPDGVRRDTRIAGHGDDQSWDPVWEAAATTDAEGWTVELRIPLSQLRFRAEREQVWGVQVIRDIGRNNEESWFAFVPKSERSGVSRYGHLVGMEALAPGGPLELMPYALTLASYRAVPRNPDVGFSNPFLDGSDYATALGVDFKYRLASNLTLDATINPDFGQVEADPAVINLSAYETRVQERRPFFTEGADVFRFGQGGPTFFNSRRIGGPPPGRVPSGAVYDDVPENSTILGAGKLTGKLAGWSIGLVDAVTGRERAAFVTEDQVHDQAPVAPLTNYFAGRARREMREGTSFIGAIATAVQRDVSDESLAGRVRSSSFTGGVDFMHEWADQSWSVGGFLAASRIAGRPSVITSAQRASARYYQRPDATHLTPDTLARSLGGITGELTLDKEAGLHWRGGLSYTTTSPGFETNDLGFQTRADQHAGRLNIEYVEERPGRVFREWNVDASTSNEWNYGGDRLRTSLDVEVGGELRNYWSGDISTSREFAALDDRLTRGGPLAGRPASTGWSVSVQSDSRKPWTLDVSGDHEHGLGGRGTSLEAGVGYRPSPRWNLSAGPSWSRETTNAQYVTSVSDALATATWGRRYVFAELEQTEVSLATRISVTFTPSTTLEVYARPFLGSGRFGSPKELAAPGRFDFVEYDAVGEVRRTADGLEIDPDGAGPAEAFEIEREEFTTRSLRGNAVLRWEWRRGSTLYLVWQQEREDETTLTSDLRLRRDLGALGRARPRNVLMLKLSYWINP